MRQCDDLDGALDGIIEDPTLCCKSTLFSNESLSHNLADPRPEALQCAPSMNTSTCLTSDQVLTVRAVLSDYIGEDLKPIFPRLQPGAELGASTSAFAGKLGITILET
ncbi:hypothetical protein EIK77_002431 [Talaromyces pinophilus]|nr:hypothetical protein EIK77_002431 [Talaromyces pinophilus]